MIQNEGSNPYILIYIFTLGVDSSLQEWIKGCKRASFVGGKRVTDLLPLASETKLPEPHKSFDQLLIWDFFVPSAS